MWKRRVLWTALMNAAGADGGSGGGDPGVGGSDASSSNPPAGGTPPAGSDGGAGGQGTGSVLNQGANVDPSAEPSAWIPEKYQVKKDDGSIDIDASARKLAEAHGHLEKRLGSGDLPPKTADEYQLTLPDTFKDVDVRADPDMAEFLQDAHAAGMNQKQVDAVMKAYAKMATTMAQGGAAASMEDCSAELRKTWASESDFKRNAGLAYQAANVAAKMAGLSYDDIEASGLGNNPTFLRLMAALGPEFSEDTSVGGESIRATSQEDVEKLMLSEAYANAKHPDHAKVSERVRKFFERKHGTEIVA